MTYQARMRSELAELGERCSKLEAFLDTEHFDALTDADQVLLLAQISHMVGYHTFLSERVERLNGEG